MEDSEAVTQTHVLFVFLITRGQTVSYSPIGTQSKKFVSGAQSPDSIDEKESTALTWSTDPVPWIHLQLF